MEEKPRPGVSVRHRPPSIIFFAAFLLMLVMFRHLDRRELTPSGYRIVEQFAKQSPDAAARLEKWKKEGQMRLTYKHLVELRDLAGYGKAGAKRRRELEMQRRKSNKDEGRK